MNISEQPRAERAPAGALCATHSTVPAHSVCSRCGGYACLPCTHSRGLSYLCAACFRASNTITSLGEASKLQRFLNLVVDGWIGGTLVSVLIGGTLGVLGAGELLDTWWISWPLLIGARVGYYVTFEATIGRTPGKLLTGTAVVSANGESATLKQIAIRSVSRFVPFDALSFVLADRGWHDDWSGTCVIRVRGKPQWDASTGSP